MRINEVTYESTKESGWHGASVQNWLALIIFKVNNGLLHTKSVNSFSNILDRYFPAADYTSPQGQKSVL